MQERKPLQGNPQAREPAKPKAGIMSSERVILPAKEQERLNDLLIEAAMYGNNTEARRLLKAGASLDVKDMNGWTLLHIAAYNGNAQTCALVIGEYARLGRDIRKLLAEKANDGDTAEKMAWYSKYCADKPQIRQLLESIEKWSESVGKETFNLFMGAFNDCVAA